MEQIWAFLLACGIPSSLAGAYIAYKINKFLQKQEKRDRAKEELNILMVQGVNASICLGEAVASAQKNGKTNGETEKALNYAVEAKRKIRDFLTQKGIESVI